MDLLRPWFDMILAMLEIFINDSYLVGILWIVIMVMLGLLLISVWKGVFIVKWKH